MRTTIHQYTIDAGWDYGCIEDTAAKGVSEYDRKALGDKGAELLLAYCKAVVTQEAIGSNRIALREVDV
jgi:hypothetical protein